MKGNFSSNFERKFGKYAIPNISLYLIICYAVGYVIQLINPVFLNYLTLDPFQIIGRFQIWRLVTWLVVPPDAASNLFFTLIMLYFYYSIGTSLERTWGTYRYNLYLFLGVVFTVLGSFLLYGYCLLTGGVVQYSVYGLNIYALANGSVLSFAMFSTYYVNMSIFLAYAATFPDMQVLLMFIFPIKVKWLGIIYGILMIYSCLSGGVAVWVAVGASLLNFIVFFFTSRNHIHMSPKQMRRRHDFKREVRHAETGSGVTKHKCAVCGRTEKDGDHLEFRFCSKCEGNYEYCQDHLFTHQHVKRH